MKVPINELARVINNHKIKSVADRHDMARELAMYLLSHQRTSDVNSLARALKELRIGSGIVEVNVSSASVLNATELRNIEALVKKIYPNADQVILNNLINHELLAGVKIDMPDRQLDLSARGKLNRFKSLTLAN